jgi:hypothetical protein
VRASTLGGQERASLMITVAFEPKDTWPNGILENSSYNHFDFNIDGTINCFYSYLRIPREVAKSIKFRKCRVRNVDEAIMKINVYIDKVNQSLSHVSEGKQRSKHFTNNINEYDDIPRQRDKYPLEKYGGGVEDEDKVTVAPDEEGTQSDQDSSTGKFGGEPFATEYFYNEWADGHGENIDVDGTMYTFFELSEEDYIYKKLKLDPKLPYYYIYEREDGFVCGGQITQKQYDKISIDDERDDPADKDSDNEDDFNYIEDENDGVIGA